MGAWATPARRTSRPRSSTVPLTLFSLVHGPGGIMLFRSPASPARSRGRDPGRSRGRIPDRSRHDARHAHGGNVRVFGLQLGRKSTHQHPGLAARRRAACWIDWWRSAFLRGISDRRDATFCPFTGLGRDALCLPLGGFNGVLDSGPPEVRRDCHRECLRWNEYQSGGRAGGLLGLGRIGQGDCPRRDARSTPCWRPWPVGGQPILSERDHWRQREHRPASGLLGCC
jgi:hypothetical protein